MLRAEVDVDSGLVHHHGIGDIGQAHRGVGGSGEQLHGHEVLRFARRAVPKKRAGHARNSDIDSVAGDGQPGSVDTDNIDGGRIASCGLAHGVDGAGAGVAGGDASGGGGGDIQWD